MKLRKTLLVSIISLFVAVGSFFGIRAIVNKNNGPEIGQIDEEDQKYKSTEIELKEGETVDSLKEDPNHVLYVASYIVSHSDYYESYYEGYAQAKVVGISYNQKTLTTKVVNEDECFFETFSLSSLVKIAEQRYLTPTSFLRRKGKNVSEKGATYGDDIQAMSKEKYLELYGSLPYSMMSYVTNDESILESAFVKEADGLYYFEYTLEPELGTIKMQRSVKTMSDAKDLPTFTSVKFALVIDSTFHVQRIECDEHYQLPIMGGLNIHSTSTENFTFNSELKELSERKEFEPYFGAKAEDDKQEEKTSMTYLTDAFTPLMSGGDSLNIDGKIKLNGFEYDLYASLDLSNMIIDLSISDRIDLHLGDGKLLLALGNNAISVSSNDVMKLISSLTGGDPDKSFSLDSLLESPILAEAMETMKDERDGNIITISMNLLDLIDVEIVLEVKEDDTASIKLINAFIEYEGLNIEINVDFNAKAHEYRKLSDVQEVNLEKLYDSISYFISRETFDFSMEIGLPIEGMGLTLLVSGYVTPDFKDLLNSEIKLDLILLKGNQEISANIIYKNRIIEIELDYIDPISISIDDVIELIDKYQDKLSSLLGIDLSGILSGDAISLDIASLIDEYLPKINLDNIIKSLTTNENELSLVLNISDFIDFDKDINLTLEYGEGLDIKLGLDSIVDLSLFGNPDKLEIDTRNAQRLDIKKLVSKVLGLIDKDEFKINLNTAFDIDGTELGLSVNGFIKLNKESLIDSNVSIDLSISYNGNVIPLKLLYSDRTISIKVTENTGFDISTSSIENIINNDIPDLKLLLKKFGINTDSSELDSSFDVSTLIDKVFEINLSQVVKNLVLTDDGIRAKLALDAILDDFNNAINLYLPYDESDIIVEIENLLGVSLNSTEEKVDFTKEFDYTVIEIDEIIESVIKFFNNPYYDIDTQIELNVGNDKLTLKLDGYLKLDFDSLIDSEAELEVSLLYKEEEIKVFIKYSNQEILLYLKDNLAVKLSIDDIKDLIDNYSNDVKEIVNSIDLSVLGIELPEIPFTGSDSGFDLGKLLDTIFNADLCGVLKKTQKNEKTLVFVLNASQLLEFEEDIIISIDYKDSLRLAVSIDNLLDLDLISSSKEKTSREIGGVILTKSDITEYIELLKEYVNNPLFNMKVKGENVVDGKKLILDGDITIDLSDISLDGRIAFQYATIKGEVIIKKIGETIEIRLGNISLKLSFTEAKELIKELNERFNIIDPETFDLIDRILSGLDGSLNEVIANIKNILDDESKKEDSESIGFDFTKLLGALSYVNGILDSINLTETGINVDLDLKMFGLDIGCALIGIDRANPIFLNASIYGFDISLAHLESYNFSLDEHPSITKDNVLYLLDLVDSLLRSIEDRVISLDINGRIIEDNQTKVEILGSLYVKLNEELSLSFEALNQIDAHVVIYTEDMIHEIKLWFVDKVFYVEYSNYASNDRELKNCKGTTKLYFGIDKILEALNYANQMFIRNEFLGTILKNYGMKLDSSALDGAITSSDEIIDITTIVNLIEVTSSSLRVLLNHDFINDYNPGGSASIALSSTIKNGLLQLSSLRVTDFFTGEKTKLEIEANFNDNTLEVTAPDLTGYSNLDILPELLVKLNNTIQLKSYDVSGTISLKLLTFNFNVDVTLKIRIDGDYIKVYGKIEVPSVPLCTNDKTRTEFYYDNSESDNFYIKRGIYGKSWGFYTNTIKSYTYKEQTLDEFMDDILENIIYMLNLSDMIANTIRNSGNDESSEDKIYFANILESIGYTENHYDIVAKGKTLTSVLGNVTANIFDYSVGDDLYFNKVKAQTSIVSIITVTLDGTLNNFNDSFSYDTFNSELNAIKLSDFKQE